MTRFVFTIPGKSIGKGRPRFTRNGHAYTPAKTKDHEGFVRHLAAMAASGSAPMTGPVSMTILVQVRPADSWSKRRRAHCLSGCELPQSTPDLDNIGKAISDGCNGILYVDDKQIAELNLRKSFAEIDQTFVVVEDIDCNVMGTA